MNTKEIQTMIPVFSKASEKTIASILPYLNEKKYKKGTHIFLDKEAVDNIYFLLEGACSFYKLGYHEEKRVIFIQSKKDILNIEMLDDNSSSLNCECLLSTKVLYIKKDTFLSAMEIDEQLNKAVMEVMTLQIRRLYHQLKNTVNAMCIDKRIAAKLWKMARDHGIKTKEGTEISFPLSITFLAEMIGAKRESVSKQVKVLVNIDLLIIKNKRIIIPDTNKLLDYVNIP